MIVDNIQHRLFFYIIRQKKKILIPINSTLLLTCSGKNDFIKKGMTRIKGTIKENDDHAFIERRRNLYQIFMCATTSFRDGCNTY